MWLRLSSGRRADTMYSYDGIEFQLREEVKLLRGVVGNLVAILVDHKSLSAEDLQKILGSNFNCEVVDD